MLEIVTMVLGPVSTNAYLLADSETGEAAVIDPAWDGERIAAEAEKRGWRIGQVWVTHAHFDHIGGLAQLADSLIRSNHPSPQVALHSADLPLWREGGLGGPLGLAVEPGPEPAVDLATAHGLSLGGLRFEVRHAPGHTPGLCVFYCAAESVLFSGDLIFQGGVGRTDLPGGDWETLLDSIRTRVLTLPDETLILPGHGPETTVGEERANNPFVGASAGDPW
jgi:glyoxylase-like metal-dependent hydrolase (beta-lactamase superfamily II)